MSEISDEFIDDGITTIINHLKSPLYIVRKHKGVSLSDVNQIEPIDDSIDEITRSYYGVTVNISPHKYMNKRKWSLYSTDQQRKILLRIENSFRVKNPSVKLIELHFETCPNLKHEQIHFHALYDMPEEFVSHMECYYNRVCNNNNENTRIPWRHIVIKHVSNVEGWVDYIRKCL